MLGFVVRPRSSRAAASAAEKRNSSLQLAHVIRSSRCSMEPLAAPEVVVQGDMQPLWVKRLVRLRPEEKERGVRPGIRADVALEEGDLRGARRRSGARGITRYLPVLQGAHEADLPSPRARVKAGFRVLTTRSALG